LNKTGNNTDIEASIKTKKILISVQTVYTNSSNVRLQFIINYLNSIYLHIKIYLKKNITNNLFLKRHQLGTNYLY